MSSNLKILVIAPEYPYPPDNGHKLRNANLLKRLSSNHRFDLLTFGSTELLHNRTQLIKQVGSSCESVEIVPENTQKKIDSINWYSKIKNIFYPFKLSLGLPGYSEEMTRMVNEKIASPKYDLVFFCGLSIFLYADMEHIHTQYVVDVVDSLSLFCESSFKKEKNVKKKLFSYLNYLWAIRYEKIHFSKAKNMILISPIDMDYIKKNCLHSKIWVVPNGVDTEYFKSRNKSIQSRNTLFFSGVMDYSPNNESMIYFIKEILPLVRRRIPDVFLVIAGKNPTHELQAIAHKTHGIKLTGFVQDMRPFFEDAMIYVAPMIAGAGLKNKVLEAWAMSKPVVATPMACNGLNAVNEENILIAETPGAFAEKILMLLSNPELKKKLGNNGRKMVEESYSWESKSRMLEKIFNELLKI